MFNVTANYRIISSKIRDVGFLKTSYYVLVQLCRGPYSFLWTVPFLKSYSQCREDTIIDTLLNAPERGMYIDIGACDPERLSNTKRFYDRGWSGINIEPNYDGFLKFRRHRPRDTNLNIGIAENPGESEFYRIDPASRSTFSYQEVLDCRRKGFHVRSKHTIEIRRLTDVVDEFVTEKAVEFLSVDTEGWNLAVLKSNDWASFRPKIVCVEVTGTDHAEIVDFLSNKDYTEFTTTYLFGNPLNCIFVKNSYLTNDVAKR